MFYPMFIKEIYSREPTTRGNLMTRGSDIFYNLIYREILRNGGSIKFPKAILI